MSYWWHSAAAPTAAGAGLVVVTPATVAAIAATPAATERGSVQTPLPAPTGLLITNLAETQLTVDWAGVVGARSYDVERNGTIIATNVVQTQYDDTGLSPNTSYRYRISAKP